jgi:hypothetical protein
LGFAADVRKRRSPLLREQGASIGLLPAVLVLIVILAILGFAVLKFLLIVAAILLVLWLLGFVARGSGGARWYRW